MSDVRRRPPRLRRGRHQDRRFRARVERQRRHRIEPLQALHVDASQAEGVCAIGKIGRDGTRPAAMSLRTSTTGSGRLGRPRGGRRPRRAGAAPRGGWATVARGAVRAPTSGAGSKGVGGEGAAPPFATVPKASRTLTVVSAALVSTVPVVTSVRATAASSSNSARNSVPRTTVAAPGVQMRKRPRRGVTRTWVRPRSRRRRVSTIPVEP